MSNVEIKIYETQVRLRQLGITFNENCVNGDDSQCTLELFKDNKKLKSWGQAHRTYCWQQALNFSSK